MAVLNKKLRAVLGDVLHEKLKHETDVEIAAEIGLSRDQVGKIRREQLIPRVRIYKPLPPKHEHIPGEHPKVVRKIKK